MTREPKGQERRSRRRETERFREAAAPALLIGGTPIAASDVLVCRRREAPVSAAQEKSTLQRGATNVMISIADFESTWDEIDRCREREELTRAIAISRRQFETGACQSEGEVFDEMEKMLDEMQSNGDCK